MGKARTKIIPTGILKHRANSLHINNTKPYSLIIHQSVSWQVQSLFQSKVSTYCDLELPPSHYPLLSTRSSSSFMLLLPRLHITSIPPFIFPSITCCRTQFLRKIWPIQLAFRLFISCMIFLCSLNHLSWRTSNTRARTLPKQTDQHVPNGGGKTFLKILPQICYQA
jgi:hypothetical protein